MGPSLLLSVIIGLIILGVTVYFVLNFIPELVKLVGSMLLSAIGKILSFFTISIT